MWCLCPSWGGSIRSLASTTLTKTNSGSWKVISGNSATIVLTSEIKWERKLDVFLRSLQSNSWITTSLVCFWRFWKASLAKISTLMMIPKFYSLVCADWFIVRLKGTKLKLLYMSTSESRKEPSRRCLRSCFLSTVPSSFLRVQKRTTKSWWTWLRNT